ncbi:S8 family serine peptidase [Mesobacillus jeotgali]|uniref:S8 family serine peptidase n=1 Tax=Mesobacillus jeotgali TaxID=129985 RepID=A0ABY9VFR2_9BACI|nr:S8 family serine peptidase [Mesobacillus jeotgali]WNF22738.1 S8 family serine peptidase [Mesobacillus jeotgali]
MFKRISTILLVVLLVFANSGFAFTGGFTPLQLDAQKPDLQKTNILATDLQDVDPNKEVRVIIEIDGDAPVEIATKKGVKYDNLSKGERKQLENAAKNKQKAAKDKIKGKKLDIEYLQEFNAIVNGFSAKVKYGEIEKIKEVAEVKQVYLATEYELPTEEAEMKYSKELVEAQQAWRDFGYNGEGMVVGIIDSGLDPAHKDFLLTDGSKAKLSEELVNSVIDEHELPGQYINEKVPYAWNYMDGNDIILDSNADTNMHGMHVGGTVAANGDEENGGIKGVAPEAQLLALRVFGNNVATTYGDIYIKAIDDSLKLGADVLNMSLGSTAGFVDAESPEQQAIKRAVDNGVVMSISAGNSAYYGNGYYYPYSTNPDYGVVGAPGVSYDSISVASYENTFMDVDAAGVSIDGGAANKVMFLSAGQTAPTVGTSFELVHAGLGYPENFEGKDLTGKFALIQRGVIGFVDKALNAQKAGAAGVIIYNNADGTISMATDAAIKIPQLFMLKSDGDRFAAALEAGQKVTVSFGGEKMTIPNGESGKMSEFSSWGITPNLDFKPELTAPGGQIYSTHDNNEYGVKSGTSMAAPHVSGGSALVLQRVDEEFGFDGAARSKLAKKFLLNTAKPVDFDGAPVSPRRQGAGLMQLHAALSTPVTVTDSTTGEAKVALKEVNDNIVTFSLTAENHSDEAVSYDVSASAQTDAPVNGGGVFVSAPNMFGALDLGEVATVNGAPVSTIEVPANGTATFEVTVDVSSLDEELKSYFTNGYWLEGFVKLTDPTDTNPDLVVPYVGFKGDWDAAPILDAPMWDSASFYGMTGVGTHIGGGEYDFLGYDLATESYNPELIAISPNNDDKNDSATYILSLLRNAKEFKLNVLNVDGKVVKEIASEEFVRKNYYDGGRGAMYYLYSDWTWDGTMHNGKIAPEGQYFLQVEATLDFEGAVAQSFTFPVKLDVTAPKVKTKLGKDAKTVSVDATDKTSGVAYWYVKVDGELVTEEPYVNGETEHVLAEPVTKGQEVTIVAVDNAGNTSSETVKIGNNGKGNKK